jgi:hypothetical protein
MPSALAQRYLRARNLRAARALTTRRRPRDTDIRPSPGHSHRLMAQTLALIETNDSSTYSSGALIALDKKLLELTP